MECARQEADVCILINIYFQYIIMYFTYLQTRLQQTSLNDHGQYYTYGGYSVVPPASGSILLPRITLNSRIHLCRHTLETTTFKG